MVLTSASTFNFRIRLHLEVKEEDEKTFGQTELWELEEEATALLGNDRIKTQSDSVKLAPDFSVSNLVLWLITISFVGQ